uniref:Uncharacterized protein n=1 Tax=viral metagenome TaxID=1070528 RepID=A0A6C0BMH4_9ZZZZ
MGQPDNDEKRRWKCLVQFGKPSKIYHATREDHRFLDYLRRHLHVLLGNLDAAETIIRWLLRERLAELKPGHYELVKNHWAHKLSPHGFLKMSAIFVDFKVPIDFEFFHQYMWSFRVLGYDPGKSFMFYLNWTNDPNILSQISQYFPTSLLELVKMLLLVLNRQCRHMFSSMINPWTQVKHHILFFVFANWQISEFRIARPLNTISP